MIGTKIKKDFNGVKYKGYIKKYNDLFYKIKYLDNDQEDLNHYKVSRIKAEDAKGGG